MTTFLDLNLHRQVLKAVTAEGYETPTPIQLQSIPHLLERRDLLGIAQTGTGKTAAFALPTLNHLRERNANRAPKSTKVLVLAPTRELASQIETEIARAGQMRIRPLPPRPVGTRRLARSRGGPPARASVR